MVKSGKKLKQISVLKPAMKLMVLVKIVYAEILKKGSNANVNRALVMGVKPKRDTTRMNKKFPRVVGKSGKHC
jgi:hypothetical protein